MEQAFVLKPIGVSGRRESSFRSLMRDRWHRGCCQKIHAMLPLLEEIRHFRYGFYICRYMDPMKQATAEPVRVHRDSIVAAEASHRTIGKLHDKGERHDRTQGISFHHKLH